MEKLIAKWDSKATEFFQKAKGAKSDALRANFVAIAMTYEECAKDLKETIND